MGYRNCEVVPNNALNYRSLHSLDSQKLRFWLLVSLIVRHYMKPKQLSGSAQMGTIGAMDGDGNIADLSHVVFPILRQTSDLNFHLVGTGFFVADNGIFVTAKHVLMDVFDQSGNQTHPIVLIQFLGGKYFIRNILRCTSHETADISVGIAAQMKHNTTGAPLTNKILRLTQRIPPIKEQVCTYAYPKTVIKHDVKQELHFYPDFFEGTIEEHYLQGRDSVLMPGPCMQTSMYIHGGASGGPVFDSAGKVCGINSTGFENSNLSFVTPISTIENLLLSEIFIPSNKSGQVRVSELIDGSFVSYEKHPGA
jgi:hypothetical protein